MDKLKGDMIYTCTACNKHFVSPRDWKLEDAVKTYEKFHGEKPNFKNGDDVLVCDDCYKKIMMVVYGEGEDAGQTQIDH